MQRQEIKLVLVLFIRFLQTTLVVSHHWLLVSPTLVLLLKNSDKSSCCWTEHLTAAVSPYLSNLYKHDKAVPKSLTGQVISLPEEKWWKQPTLCLQPAILLHPAVPKGLSFFIISIKKIFLTFIYYWERESMSRGGAERGRHGIRSRLQALNCQHRAWHGARTHECWDHDLSWSQTPNWLSLPGAPEGTVLNKHLKHVNETLYACDSQNTPGFCHVCPIKHLLYWSSIP